MIEGHFWIDDVCLSERRWSFTLCFTVSEKGDRGSKISILGVSADAINAASVIPVLTSLSLLVLSTRRASTKFNSRRRPLSYGASRYLTVTLPIPA